ncbi:MAG: hypothetical protein WC750_03445 [Patescibacteria group bacterium]|jgi:hypothetical protein
MKLDRKYFVQVVLIFCAIILILPCVVLAEEENCGSYGHCGGYVASTGKFADQTCCLPKTGSYTLGGQNYTAADACPGDWYKTVGVCKPDGQFVCCAKTLSKTATSTSSGPATPVTNQLVVPKLNIAIPGLVFATDYYEEGGALYVPFLGQYISAFFKYILGVGLVATAIMLVWGGMLYLFGSTGLQVSDAKKKIIDAIIGMIIIIGSYVILANLNPNLVSPPGIKIGIIKAKPYVLMGSKEYGVAIKEAKPEFRSDMDKVPPDEPAIFAYLNKRAKELGINICVAEGIVRSESGGNPNAVNHNENFSTVAAQERVDFLRGGLKYSGAGFVKEMPDDCSINAPERKKCENLALSGPKNDDSAGGDPSKTDGGFDWNWTHDFGLGAINIATKKGGSWCNPQTPSRKIGDQCFTWFDLLTVKGALEAMLSHPSLRGSNPDSMARGYVGQSCGPGCEPYVLKFKIFSNCLGK